MSNPSPLRTHAEWPRRRPARALALLTLAALLAACAAPPPKAPPPAALAVPAQFKEGAGLWKRAAAVQPGGATAEVPQDWWRLFNDPQLDALQRDLVIGNQNLQIALAQVASARAVLQASEAARWPTLGLGAAASRSGAPAAGEARLTSNTLALSANAAWEVDLWGRLALAQTAAGARLQASADDLAAARLSAQATLTQSYFALRSAEAQQALLERSAQAGQRVLALTQARYDAGVVGRSDVLQAQTQLKSVQAQISDAQLQRAQSEHAIAVLLGKAPAQLTLARSAVLPALPPLPALLPSTLLERRPDIAAAERRVAAAYAQIGIADAAYFPELSLSASAGLRGPTLGSLFSASSLLWSLGPSLALSVFDGGARQHASDTARAQADAAAASYRQTVLTAFQEVEDNLAALAQLGTELQLQQDALQAAQRNLEITEYQYKAGTVSFLNVANAQTAALAAESSLLALRNRQLQAANLLLKNIGGSWSAAGRLE